MSHHSINLNLNLNLPANQKPLYRLIWFQIQVLCVTFYPTFSRLWLERNWIFYVRCWACMMDAGLSLRVFSPAPALLYAVAWSLEKGSALGGWGTWGGPALLHWWMAINNITSYWKHHLFCWSLLGSLLLPFSQGNFVSHLYRGKTVLWEIVIPLHLMPSSCLGLFSYCTSTSSFERWCLPTGPSW